MKKEILNLLGSNQTTPAVFKNRDLGAVYTYENDVYCIKDGMDFPFEDLNEVEQSEILKDLKEQSFKFDNTYQG